MEKYDVECGFVCWDGGRREIVNGKEVCILDRAPGVLHGSGKNHTIVLREGIRPGTEEYKQALTELINQALWLRD